MVVQMIAGCGLFDRLGIGGAPGPFPAEQVAIAREVAQFAIALAWARLRELVRRQAEELELRVRERTHDLQQMNIELHFLFHARRQANGSR